MKYIVCYSGGIASSICAIECAKRFNKEDIILLNHDISSEVENADIKRFKEEVANYIGIPITYANMDNFEQMTPLRVCKSINGFKFNNGPVLCTYHLKTKPFHEWLHNNYPVPENGIRDDIRIVYGFAKDEMHRVKRRDSVMNKLGYLCEYPLINWENCIKSTEEIGIKRPKTYSICKHANCTGCLKAGRQHWYMVYCLHPDIFEEAKETEKYIGYSIIKGVFLSELEKTFAIMRDNGIQPTEKIIPQKFWSNAKRVCKEI